MRSGATNLLFTAGVVLILTVPIQAQLITHCGSEVPLPYRTTKPGVEVPMVADTIVQITDRAPWGTFTQTWKGKFYRTRDGKCRDDDPYGHTILLMLPYDFSVDHESKTVQVLIRDSSLPGGDALLWSGDSKMSRSAVIGGRKVVGPREDRTFGDGISDRWFDAKWGVLVDSSWKRPASDWISQLINIQERDPDPELFKIPSDYTVVRCKAATPGQRVKFPTFCPSEKKPAKK